MCSKNNQTVQMTNSNPNSCIDDQLSCIFKSRKSKCIVLANRRDVINKSILRGFKRFFVNLLSQNKKGFSDSPKKSKIISKSSLYERAIEFGLLNLKPKHESSIEFEDFIWWLGFVKITKKVRMMFSSDNPAINLMEDLISNYSHRKLQLALNNESIKALLAYFIQFGKRQFMSNNKFNTENSSNLNSNTPE